MAVILEVSFCLTPKWVACQVTYSFNSISPLVLPAMACSLVLAVDFTCKSILRDKSKHISIGALIMVSNSILAKWVYCCLVKKYVILKILYLPVVLGYALYYFKALFL